MATSHYETTLGELVDLEYDFEEVEKEISESAPFVLGLALLTPTHSSSAIRSLQAALPHAGKLGC